MKFVTGEFYKELSSDSNFHVYITILITTLHEHLHAFLCISCQIFFRVENVLHKVFNMTEQIMFYMYTLKFLCSTITTVPQTYSKHGLFARQKLFMSSFPLISTDNWGRNIFQCRNLLEILPLIRSCNIFYIFSNGAKVAFIVINNVKTSQSEKTVVLNDVKTFLSQKNYLLPLVPLASSVCLLM
jgi:hypothetical protein